jgi:hypothetical protein
MDEERFNLSVRKLLLAGRDGLDARATMVVDGLPTDIVVTGRIDLT